MSANALIKINNLTTETIYLTKCIALVNQARNCLFLYIRYAEMQFSGLDTRHSLWVPFYVLKEIFVKFALLNGNRYGYDKYFRLCGVLDW